MWRPGRSGLRSAAASRPDCRSRLPTETQRDAPRDLARTYCHTDEAIEAMTDADLLAVWREGFG